MTIDNYLKLGKVAVLQLLIAFSLNRCFEDLLSFFWTMEELKKKKKKSCLFGQYIPFHTDIREKNAYKKKYQYICNI